MPTNNIETIKEDNRQLKLQNKKLLKAMVRYRIANDFLKDELKAQKKEYLNIKKHILTEPTDVRDQAWGMIQNAKKERAKDT